LDHQNNFVDTLKIMNNAAKSFDILATSLSILHMVIIFTVQQNYFSYKQTKLREGTSNNR